MAVAAAACHPHTPPAAWHPHTPPAAWHQLNPLALCPRACARDEDERAPSTETRVVEDICYPESHELSQAPTRIAAQPAGRPWLPPPPLPRAAAAAATAASDDELY